MGKTESIWARVLGMAAVVTGIIFFIGAIYQHDMPMAKTTFIISVQGAWLLSLAHRV